MEQRNVRLRHQFSRLLFHFLLVHVKFKLKNLPARKTTTPRTWKHNRFKTLQGNLNVLRPENWRTIISSQVIHILQTDGSFSFESWCSSDSEQFLGRHNPQDVIVLRHYLCDFLLSELRTRKPPVLLRWWDVVMVFLLWWGCGEQSVE